MSTFAPDAPVMVDALLAWSVAGIAARILVEGQPWERSGA
jgi:hypothetical protein